MRAVLDANVLIAALLSRDGAPAGLVRLWIEGRFELVVSEQLLDEVDRAFTYPKLRKRVSSDEVRRFLMHVRRSAILAQDAGGHATLRSSDPNDDYLLVLAESTDSVLVSGDKHLLDLSGSAPIVTPRSFLEQVERLD